MSLLRRAKRGVLRPIVKAVAGRSVRYHSVATGEVYDVVATLDDAAGEVETSDGMTIPFHSGVFKIDRVDLPVMPQRLDTMELIDEDNPARVEWFQVLSDSAIDHVAPNDNDRDVWRISTKWVPDADVSTSAMYGNADGLAYGAADGTAHGGASR